MGGIGRVGRRGRSDREEGPCVRVCVKDWLLEHSLQNGNVNSKHSNLPDSCPSSRPSTGVHEGGGGTVVVGEVDDPVRMRS